MSKKDLRYLYKEYINSSRWAEKKRLYKLNHCEICFSITYLDLHHLTYDNLTQETQEDLATLCKYCHFAFHINVKSSKRLRSPSRAMAKLVRRIRHGLKPKGHIADFLGRRYIVKYGEKNIPSFKSFVKQVYLFKHSRGNLDNWS